MSNDEPRLTMIEQVVAALKEIEPGMLDLDLFLEFSRLSVSAIVELVPVRKNPEGNVEVLLFRRPADDPFWPNLWANPGTVLRPTDTKGGINGAFARMYDEDMGGISPDGQPVFADNIFAESERGASLCAVHWLEVEEPGEGTFFPIDKLPKDTVEAIVDVVNLAAEDFRRKTG